jgi:endonuclease YncB( thermonuclease family)
LKVRLSGIDAPERRQAYGERAKEHLAALTHGKAVLVTWTKRDRYGRIVGRVLAPECSAEGCRYTLDVALEQIKAGFAWHYKHYEREQAPHERIRYSALELEARLQRNGLWNDPRPVAPWSYRQRPEASAPADDT